MLITLPLYILRELTKAFLMSLLIYSFVFLVIFCSEVIRTDVTLLTVLEIVPSIFPLISRLVLPLSIITGILICYGRFAANNEFIAAQASGVHPLWLGAPGLLVASFAAIITVYLNADVMTRAVINMERRILADRTNIINTKLEKPGSFSFKIPNSITFAICRLPATWSSTGKIGIDFSVFKQPDHRLKENELWDAHFPYPETRILAKNHQIKVTEDEHSNMTIVGDFWDAIETNKLGRNIASIQTMPHTSAKFIHPNSGFDIVFDSRRLQYMGIDKLKLVRDELQQRYHDAVLANDHAQSAQHQKELLNADTEINVKLVMSFACISFAFFGIPLAMLSKRNNTTIGFAIGFGFAFVFYMIMTALQNAVRSGALEWYSLWLPNLIILIISGFLWIKMIRKLA